MSLVLGKIHYWLFNKIVWFEDLETELINLATEEGLNVSELKEKIDSKYGERLPGAPLEDIIDQGNIHGWLQGKIYSAEGRLAAWTVQLLNLDNIDDKIKSIYINQGISAAKEVKESGKECKTAVDIFNSMNDYILDGMPCDRVNEIVESEASIVKWERRMCVHKDIWSEAGGDVQFFYSMRAEWIKAFIKEINDNFMYLEDDGFTIIEKR